MNYWTARSARAMSYLRAGFIRYWWLYFGSTGLFRLFICRVTPVQRSPEIVLIVLFSRPNSLRYNYFSDIGRAAARPSGPVKTKGEEGRKRGKRKGEEGKGESREMVAYARVIKNVTLTFMVFCVFLYHLVIVANCLFSSRKSHASTRAIITHNNFCKSLFFVFFLLSRI